jgi:gluconolactonase
MSRLSVCLILSSLLMNAVVASAEPLPLELRYQTEKPSGSGTWETRTRQEKWKPEETAIVVCDVWDQHHCLNAVRRLEQFAPRLNDVLKKAREQGVTIIHSPSDCMAAYADHPARQRAMQAPQAAFQPFDVKAWCSAIPAEERAAYPIDQSDGGEDDDPAEHAEWAAKLTAMGRKAGTPWLTQNKLITIDGERDYISDRGDEVWNLLEARGIRNVILTGVHLNMCVLGRPFGLRQMVRNGKNTVLMRDMTDTMYNPKRWPYVSHLKGTELVVAHVERYVCPSITSDQILGGKPFELTPVGSGGGEAAAAIAKSRRDYVQRWVNADVPGDWRKQSNGLLADYDGPAWYRCVVLIPNEWAASGVRLSLPTGSEAWLNGHAFGRSGDSKPIAIPGKAIEAGDHNLLVMRVNGPAALVSSSPVVTSGGQSLTLAGRWQMRIGEGDFSSIPLPAKFGGSADIVFSPEEPLWVARPLTRPHEFTPGIEGPACDADGNIFVVNYEKQGTIGRVTPQGAGEVFVELPAGSTGNGIRFDRAGNFYVADYTGHNVLKVDPKTKNVTVLGHNDQMNQPNDLAIDADGTLYASDPNWANGGGQLWRIDTDGTVTRLADNLGTTNGIEVSPDGRTLYVNESQQRNVWAFSITAQKTLSNKRLVKQFEDHGFDGMRCDVDGNLYITRYGKGTVVKLSPQGEVLREITLPGKALSNICFGGPDGRTAYVTEVDLGRLVTFRVDKPGLAWTRHQR